MPTIFQKCQNDKLIVDPDHDFKFDRFDYLNWDEYRDESIKRLKVIMMNLLQPVVIWIP